MKPPAFDYASPTTLDDAIRLLAASDGNAKIISGGQSLMPMLAFRLASPGLLVDLKRIEGLEHIVVGEDGVRLGAKVRWRDIERNRQLKVSHPLLFEAVRHVAHYQIRNRGTVGGSLAHADPSAELPGVAMTCEAEIAIVGAGGERLEKASDFFTGSLETSLAPHEILTEIRLPYWPPQRRWAFQEFARRKGDFAIAGVMLFYDLDGRGQAIGAHVGAIGVADLPVRLFAAEKALDGSVIDETVIAAAVSAATDSIDPPSDIHAPGNYRKALLGTLLSRALQHSVL